MPGDRDDEICQKALELLSDLCSKGEVQNENCLDFIYYFRDLARPRYTDSGEASSCSLFKGWGEIRPASARGWHSERFQMCSVTSFLTCAQIPAVVSFSMTHLLKLTVWVALPVLTYSTVSCHTYTSISCILLIWKFTSHLSFPLS